MRPRLRRTAMTTTVADLIWRHADQTPDAVAVIDATGTATTYRELVRWADTVAGCS